MKNFLCTSGVLLAAMLVLASSTTVMAATRPQATAQHALALGDGPGRDVVLSDLPNVSAAQLAAAKQPPYPRNPSMSDAQYQAAKTAALHSGVGTRPADGANIRIPSGASARVGIFTAGAFADFLGQSQGCNGTLWTPSDMALAVSSNYVLQVVNECVSVYNKAGALLSGPKDLCGIWGLPPNAGAFGCFDPRALYDAQANKFVIIASYYDNVSGDGFILTAAATNPTLAWHTHRVSRGPALADYPTLGQTAYLNNPSNSVITVCNNLFFNTGGFTDECLVMPKRGVYGTLGSFPVWFNFSLGGVLQNSIQAVNSYELSDNPRVQYAINSVNDNGGICAASSESGLVLWAFSGSTAGQPRATGWFTGCGSTSYYSFPGDADNAGFCSACIETIDNRISGMVFYSQGELFPSIDTNNGYSSAVLGWKVHPYLDDNGLGCTGSAQCAAFTAVNIEQEFCYDCGGGTLASAYFGDIAPDPENDWTMFATFSNTTRSPGQFYTSNRVSWLSPFHDGGIYSCVNNAAYSQYRWGDYAAAAPDDPGNTPKNVAAVWGSGMYVQSNGLWGTCIAGNRPQDAP